MIQLVCNNFDMVIFLLMRIVMKPMSDLMFDLIFVVFSNLILCMKLFEPDKLKFSNLHILSF